MNQIRIEYSDGYTITETKANNIDQLDLCGLWTQLINKKGKEPNYIAFIVNGKVREQVFTDDYLFYLDL